MSVLAVFFLFFLAKWRITKWMVVTLYLCFNCWQLFFSKTLEWKVSNGSREYHELLISNVICYKVAQ